MRCMPHPRNFFNANLYNRNGGKNTQRQCHMLHVLNSFDITAISDHMVLLRLFISSREARMSKHTYNRNLILTDFKILCGISIFRREIGMHQSSYQMSVLAILICCQNLSNLSLIVCL